MLNLAALRRGANGVRAAAIALISVSAVLLAPRAALAEVSDVRIVRQFGIHYLPLVIMEYEKLLEKAASAAGLGDIKVEWTQLSGGSNVNDALLSKAVHLTAGGVGPLLVLWDKSRGGKGDVKALAAVSDVPMTLTTRNPAIKSIEDFTDADRIALPAVKTSMQAVTLQMAAAKRWGPKDYERLDRLTVTLAHPTALTALLSGAGEINSHFTAAPFDVIELRDPKVHAVLDSYDVLGGPATLILLYATQSFCDENPKICAATNAAMASAMDLIRAHKRRAASIYLDVTHEKATVDDLTTMLANPKIAFRLDPSGTYATAEFLHSIGRMKTKPATWKDYFFPIAHGLKGS
ncbi:MAG: ABC transporter substrate-binding protein [Proteobacteria bacterium]|nr:ABC transporter substrate-binding protein [Pseudomonadota bacterium]